ncbi:MAG: CAP domain-containing protein [Chlorobiaceae bacterium]|nr:CAP domain-containing protein [Chlorobiaceae bacterium]
MRINPIVKSSLLFIILMFCSGNAEGRNEAFTGSSPRSAEQRHLKWNEEALDQQSSDQNGGEPGPSQDWMLETIDTTRGADYMTRTERQVVIEINMMRSDPARYAQRYLVPLRSYYQGRLIKFPGKIPLSTREGVAALEECIRELKRASPLPCLSPREGLTLAARDHVRDQGRTGAIGHGGSDSSTPFTRMNRYGRWEHIAAENISYGFNDARTIVAFLLIDDGVPSRGHRKNLLNDSFRLVGVDIGPHRTYRDMCVMDFAGGYQSKGLQEGYRR